MIFQTIDFGHKTQKPTTLCYSLELLHYIPSQYFTTNRVGGKH